MSILNANNTTLIGCRVYQQSFGHCIHFHEVDGVRIEGCHFTGALRPTDDIFLEVAGRAHEYDFRAMYRGKRPMPKGEMIPLVEDGIRAYERVKNITVIDTVVERMRGGVQLLCTGDVRLEGVTIRESGDFALDVSAGNLGKVIVKGCRVDASYRPVFNLTRGAPPVKASFDLTVFEPRHPRPTNTSSQSWRDLWRPLQLQTTRRHNAAVGSRLRSLSVRWPTTVNQINRA